MKKIRKSQRSKLLFFCQSSHDYLELVEQLSVEYSVKMISNKTAFENLTCKMTFDIVLIETPKDLSLLPYLLNLVQNTQVRVKSVMLVNGTLTQKALAEAFKNGIDDFFPYPVNISLLLERIKSVLER